jgi:hypothetical protein
MENVSSISEYDQFGVRLKGHMTCRKCESVLVKSKGMLYFGLRDPESGQMYFALARRLYKCCGKEYDMPILFSNMYEIQEFIDELNEMAKKIPPGLLIQNPLIRIKKIQAEEFLS